MEVTMATGAVIKKYVSNTGHMNNNKLYIGLGVAMLALSFASCQNDERLADVDTVTDGAVQLITIGGIVGNDAGSRAQVVLDNEDTTAEYFVWNAGDSFSLYDIGSDGSTVPTSSTTFTISSDYSDDSPSASASFTGECDIAAGNAIAAIYPAQSRMLGVTEEDLLCELGLSVSPSLGSNSNEEIAAYLASNMLMHATGIMDGNSTSLTFQHLTAMIRISLTNVSSSDLPISSISVTGDDNYFAYNSVCSLNGSDPGHAYSDETYILTQTFDDLTIVAGDSTDIYLLFVPGESFNEDGTITFTLNDNLSVSVATSLISTDSFVTGYRYKYNLTIDDEGLYRTATYGTKGLIDGYEYVDLGLSVMWATCNVGADSPEGYGDYYAWGETTTKSTYKTDNSVTYGTRISGGIAGNVDYDAARANWGGTWRLPTQDEMEELVDECTWTWTSRNDVNGYLVTSNVNDNSVFLPAAGRYSGASLSNVGTYGGYWVSTPDDDTSYASCLRFGNTYHYLNRSYRYYGLSIRPVSDMTSGQEEMTSTDAGSDGDSSNVTIIETNDGESLLITGVWDYTYEYDSNGILTTYAPSEYISYDVSDNGTYFKFSSTYYTITKELTLNEYGYIAEETSCSKYTGNYPTTTTNVTYFTYDESGHLTSVTDVETTVGTLYSSGPYTTTWTLTWDGDLLTKMVYKEPYNGSYYTETYEYNYGNNTYKNTYKQYVPAIWWDEGGMFLCGMAYIGLHGVGPAYLPVSFTIVDSVENKSNLYSFTYSFNNNGTVKYQSDADGSNKYSFTYSTYTGTSTRASQADKRGCR